MATQNPLPYTRIKHHTTALLTLPLLTPHSFSLSLPHQHFLSKTLSFATVSKLNNPIISTIPLPLFNSTPTSSHTCTTHPFSQTLSFGLFPSSLFLAKPMAPKLSLIVCVLAMWAVGISHGASSHHAPAPSVDCSSLVLTMADCLSYVTNGSTTAKPEGTCCSGLKSVLKTAPQCLCEAFKSSAQFGVVLNVTKAMTLPAACKVSASSAADCGREYCLIISICFLSVLYLFYFIFYDPDESILFPRKFGVLEILLKKKFHSFICRFMLVMWLCCFCSD